MSEAQRLQEHQALLSRITALPPDQLPAFVEAERENITTAFLAYISSIAQDGEGMRGKAASGGFISAAPGAAPSFMSACDLARLPEVAARLTALKEAADWEASKRVLPALAASLAYSNYSTWRRENHGQDLGDVAPGVTLEHLYRAGEREELKLQRQEGRMGPSKAPSTLDDFARRGPGAAFSDQAAAAMARVRARLTGYQDDGPGGGDLGAPAGSPEDGSAGRQSAASSGPAARRVLAALLLECSCREERAQAVAEACMPPGLEVEDSDGMGTPHRVLVCTSPKQLLAAITAELQQLGYASDQGSSIGAGNSSAGDLCSDHSLFAAGMMPALPSGESPTQVLFALREDVEDYNRAVYSRLSPLERFGAGHGRLR